MSAVYDNNQHVFVRLDSAIGRTPSAGSGSYATIASIHKSPPSPSPYATSDALRVSYYASSQVVLMSQVSILPLNEVNFGIKTRPPIGKKKNSLFTMALKLRKNLNYTIYITFLFA